MPTPNEIERPVLFLGAGNMGGAVLRGALASGVLHPDRVGVASPNAPSRHRDLVHSFDAPDAASAWLAGHDTVPMIVLGFKPWMLKDAASAWKQLFDAGPTCVVSLLAGATSRTISDTLGTAHRVLRTMPNTPSLIGKGCTAIASDNDLLPAESADARRLFQAVGTVIETTEDRIDAFAAVAGSGPAYVFYLAEAMIEAAGVVGAPEADAIVRQTIAGAAELLAQAAESPLTLRQNVSSKGGSTERATASFDADGVRAAIVRGIEAALMRNREMATQAGA